MLVKSVERHFLFIALAFSAAALAWPWLFLWIEPHIPRLLGLIMFGMGLTLDFSAFRSVWEKRHLVLLGTLLQFTIMPALALMIAVALKLPPEAMIGMVIVGACPGGTASNVIAYLARANVALSIVLTLVSNTLAPVVTPVLIYLILHQTVNVDFWAMVQSVFWIIAFPLADGLILRRLFQKRLEPLISIFPSISIIGITFVIACIMALNRETIFAFPFWIILAVIFHNLGGLILGYWGAKLFRCDETDSRTIAIEVGMQNSGLGVALAGKFFGGGITALPGAIFSLWHNLSGITLARVWSNQGVKSRDLTPFTHPEDKFPDQATPVSANKGSSDF